jgi:MFS family permease
LSSPFAYPAWRFFIAARLLGTLGGNILAVVIGWQVYDLARLTRDVGEAAFLLGMVGLAQFLPVFLLTLVVGAIADRVDRRWLARGALAFDALLAVILALLSLYGNTALWPLFAVAVGLGVARAFAGPSLSALGPNLVPADVLPKAIAWSSIAFQSGAIAGPAAGGLLYDLAAPLPYWVAAALFSAAVLALFAVGPVPMPQGSGAKGSALVKEGLSYVRGNPIVLGAISLDLAAVILAGATAMLPIYARDILAVGPGGLGLMRAAPAAGAAMVALILAFRPLGDRVGAKMFGSVALFALFTIVFGLSTLLWLSVLALFVMGATDMVSVYVRSSLIQLHTPDAMRGRVSAVSLLFISASNELGEFRAGTMAALIGAVPATVIGGALALLVTLLWARLFPVLWQADRLDVPENLKQR